MYINAEQDTRSPAFDHERLASVLAEETGETYEAEELPFDSFEYTDDESAIQFSTADTRYECDLSTYECEEIAEKGELEPRESELRVFVRTTENYDSEE